MISASVALLVDRIAELESQIEQTHRRLNNILREGRVTEVDAANGMARVDAGGLLSAPSPWLERAGKVRHWTPPSVGERVLLLSPTGEPGQGLILSGGYSDAFPAPSTDPEEQVVEVDKARVSIKPSRIKHTMKDGAFAIVAEGFAKLKRDGVFIAIGPGGVFSSHEITVGGDPFPDD